MSRRFVSILLIYAIVLQLSCNCVPAVLVQKNRDLNDSAAQDLFSASIRSEETTNSGAVSVSFGDEFMHPQSAAEPSLDISDEDFSFLASCLIDLDSIDRQQNLFYLDNASGSGPAISRLERTANPLVSSPFVSPGFPIASNCYNHTTVFSKTGLASNQVRLQYNRPLLI